MSKSMKQYVKEKARKFNANIAITKTKSEFIVEVFAPEDHFWAASETHTLMASCPRGSFTGNAWQEIHTVMKHGLKHCSMHYPACEECEYEQEWQKEKGVA